MTGIPPLLTLVPPPALSRPLDGDLDSGSDSDSSTASGPSLTPFLPRRRPVFGGGAAESDLEQLLPTVSPPLGDSLRSSRSSPRKHPLCLSRQLSVALFALSLALALLVLNALASISRHSLSTTHIGTKARLSLEDLITDKFAFRPISVNWVPEAGDGVYSVRNDDGSIRLVDIARNSSRDLVDAATIRDENGRTLLWDTFSLSSDMQLMLLRVGATDVFRFSSLATYYIHELNTSRTFQLHQPAQTDRPYASPSTSVAVFAPYTHHIAYVFERDVWIRTAQGKYLRVTDNGDATHLNGIPSWVYEEEILDSGSSLWWSPDGRHLAFLSFDETQVPDYRFPVYNHHDVKPGADAYPSETVLKYPKAGYPNPRVSLFVYTVGGDKGIDSLRSSSSLSLNLTSLFTPSDILVTSVSWISPTELIIKATNKIATVEKRAYVNVTSPELRVVREVDWESRDGGWIEPTQSIVGLRAHSMRLNMANINAANSKGSGKDQSNDNTANITAPTLSTSAYVDLVPDTRSGFVHVALFQSPLDSEPVFLTGGEWDVTALNGVDLTRGKVYFTAAQPSTERHVYSVDFTSAMSDTSAKALEKKHARNYIPEKIASRDVTPPYSIHAISNPSPHKTTISPSDPHPEGFFSASFSPACGFYTLSYAGPLVPYQELRAVDNSHTSVLVSNATLSELDAGYVHAQIEHHELDLTDEEGNVFSVNVQEILPPNADLSGRVKYPVLFHIYGGPGAQTVQKTYKRDWLQYLASEYGYAIVRVDPRGSGFKGRQFRNKIKNHLGTYERDDIINTAKHYATLPYVDEKRIGVWGWSYGGYLTTKIVERNASVFNLAMAVAPVTDWRYYDSVYTERYMSTPQLNPAGYNESMVKDMEGFKHLNFALAHGSADDNVHFQNTAALLDRLTSAHVRGYHFRMYTDSDHSMSMREAYWELMNWLEDFLVSHWDTTLKTKKKWKEQNISHGS